jgi:hypothetical protein
MYLHLDVARGYRSRHLGDNAVVCTTRRRVELDVSGYPRAWSGRTFAILLTPTAPSPPELRLDVEGRWDRNTLELREEGRSLADVLNEPNESSAADSPWIAAALTRGTRAAFDAACVALAR